MHGRFTLLSSALQWLYYLKDVLTFWTGVGSLLRWVVISTCCHDIVHLRPHHSENERENESGFSLWKHKHACKVEIISCADRYLILAQSLQQQLLCSGSLEKSPFVWLIPDKNKVSGRFGWPLSRRLTPWDSRCEQDKKKTNLILNLIVLSLSIAPQYSGLTLLYTSQLACNTKPYPFPLLFWICNGGRGALGVHSPRSQGWKSPSF